MISLILSKVSTLQAKAIALLVMAVFIFFSGWTVNGWRYEARLKLQLDEQLAYKDKVDRQSRSIISDLQNQLSVNQTNKVNRNAKIKTIASGNVCFSSNDAIELWNDALISEPAMPKNPTRTAKETTRASVTDAEILENINENFSRWKECRDQVDAIIEWDRSNFNKE